MENEVLSLDEGKASTVHVCACVSACVSDLDEAARSVVQNSSAK